MSITQQAKQFKALAGGMMQSTAKGNAASVNSAKALLVSVFMGFFVMIGVAYLAPEAYSEIEAALEDTESDIPGGSFLQGVGILLVVLAATIGVVLLVIDAI